MIRKILVVDDEPEIKDLVGELLGDLGYIVDTVASGEEALAAIDEGGYDLVISDVRLAGVSGPVLAEQIAARQPSLAKRVILFTGDPSSVATTVPVLRKPFNLDEMLRAVERQISAA